MSKRSMSEIKNVILLTVEDLASNFLYYDRKEDDDLSVQDLNDAIKNGDITRSQIVDCFSSMIQEWAKSVEKGDE